MNTGTLSEIYMMKGKLIMSAGNFSDVWKHSVLLEVIDLIKSEDFIYVESHGNYPVHKVTSNGNGHYGIRKIENSGINDEDMHYLTHQNSTLRGGSICYLSSWILVNKFLNYHGISNKAYIHEIDKAISKEAIFYLQSIDLIAGTNLNRDIEIINKDGFSGIINLINKKVTPNLVFIDPYYKRKVSEEIDKIISITEQLDEFKIPYLIWLPYKKSQKHKGAYNKLLNKFNNEVLTLNDNNPGSINNSTNITKTGMIFSRSIIDLMPWVEYKLKPYENSKMQWRIM
ncbi:hypothetical protein MKX33_03085 [Paenibacillus sp. FSL R5-0490]|uniref:hypothetical protein n=1 Tax=Paenibacillus sp. FSL R5-0490 TaxID=1920424 RepID=UPI0030D50A88